MKHCPFFAAPHLHLSPPFVLAGGAFEAPSRGNFALQYLQVTIALLASQEVLALHEGHVNLIFVTEVGEATGVASVAAPVAALGTGPPIAEPKVEEAPENIPP